MIITVNGKKQELKDGATLADLAEVLHLGASGVAVARNNRVVPRTEWQTLLEEDDSVVVIKASCGG